jgi:hypothetical protein
MSAAALVEELHDLIDRLVAMDAAALEAGELHELVVGLQRERSRLVVATAEPVRTWETERGWRKDGTLKASLALGRDTMTDHRRASYELRRARRLAELPHTREAILAGRLSIDHLDLFLQHASGRRFELFQEHEEQLVGECCKYSLFDDCRRLIQHWTHRADDLLGIDREPPPPSTLYFSRSEIDGEGILDGRLSPIDAEIVAAELDRLAREIAAEDKKNGVKRTPAQRRAAALVRMAARSLSSTGVSPRPLFQVIVGDQTATRLCQLGSGIVVHPNDLVPYIDTAVMESFLFDGATVIAKTKQRTFTGALRRAIQVRDRRCGHKSNCPVPAPKCDIDHKRAHSKGGPTSQFNGRCGCHGHNRIEELRDDPVPAPERDLDEKDIVIVRIKWWHQTARDQRNEKAS